MLTGKLFVICGLSRLAARVARALVAQNATVTLIMYEGESEALRTLLPDAVHVRRAAGENAAETLRKVDVLNAECMLALAEEDLVNLRSTVSARSVAPDVPVVIRAFDPKLADQFEQGLNVRRAFSVSALAAPAFAAAACGARVIDGVRLGEEVVPIEIVHVDHRSHLQGMRLGDIRDAWHVHVVAWRRNRGEWVLEQQLDDALPLQEGDDLILGGSPKDCMNLLAHAAGWHYRRRLQRQQPRRGFSSGSWKRRHPLRGRRSLTWLPQIALVLIFLILIAILVFEQELHLPLVDAVYFVITTLTTTGYGDISVRYAPAWVKLFTGLIMLTGGALLGIMFSYLASIATAERLDVSMARRAERMANHIVIVGLGNVGYRVGRALTDLGLDIAIVDLAPRARFFDSISERAPVLTGDARLPDTLERASIRSASAVIACTSDDLANIEACLHARRLNPNVHTVARVYDDQIVSTLTSAFSIDAVLSATHVAESSFVMAATDAAALRILDLDGLALVAGRYRGARQITQEDVAGWREQGIQALAFRTHGSPARSMLAGVADEAVILGSEAAVRAALREAGLPPSRPAAGAPLLVAAEPRKPML